MSAINRAEKQNPALQPLAFLVGTWRTEGAHPYVPDKTLHGRATFEWASGGAFILWRSEIVNDERFPNGIAVMGSDDESGEYFMLYFDERGVSRKYDVFFENNVLRWERNASKLSQRMVLTFADDHSTLLSKGEMSRDGGAWEPDLELTFIRT